MLTQSTAGHLAGPTDPAGLVLERLPNGELAWLRPELDATIRDADRPHQDLTRLLQRRDGQSDGDCRYTLTPSGRDYLAREARERAREALFGHPWPTVAEACAEAEGAA